MSTVHRPCWVLLMSQFYGTSSAQQEGQHPPFPSDRVCPVLKQPGTLGYLLDPVQAPSKGILLLTRMD